MLIESLSVCPVRLFWQEAKLLKVYMCGFGSNSLSMGLFPADVKIVVI